ncbi:hypothetical protein CKM354_000028400 [Cercospora kikuchii]|uniref:DUF7730 domain-containing protein n=1 Tax=Cercospora kikuchii TaxID=84275 RepID=A0A9P3C8N7_9PEZI|nr:uncharacterized protein CKM354_000028400 [Cercospora kikuchii]GIZ36817.1 hypothetical protein CKM354_000028400 [Cercospora kikuchii]
MALNSHLLALPAELRQEILIYVLAWPSTDIETSHLSQAVNWNLHCGVCRLGFRKDRYTGSKDTNDVVLHRTAFPTPRSVAILQTCRQIYFEAMDLIYNKTLFVITNHHTSNRKSRTYYSMWSPRVIPWKPLGSTTDCRNLLSRARNVQVEGSIDFGAQGRAAAGQMRLLRELIGKLDSPELSLHLLIHFETCRELGPISDRSCEELAYALKGINRAGCQPKITIQQRFRSFRPGDGIEQDARSVERVKWTFETAGVPFIVVDK